MGCKLEPSILKTGAEPSSVGLLPNQGANLIVNVLIVELCSC